MYSDSINRDEINLAWILNLDFFNIYNNNRKNMYCNDQWMVCVRIYIYIFFLWYIDESDFGLDLYIYQLIISVSDVLEINPLIGIIN